MVDDEALEDWFCREVLPLERSLTHFIRRNWRVADDVVDLRHDVYELAIAGGRTGLPSSTRNYVFTIARNHLINCAKRASIVSFDLVADLETIERDVDMFEAERHLNAREALRRFHEGLERLSPRVREIVKLRKIDGLNVQETAERLGIGKDAVNHQVMMGMKALADFMLGGSGKIVRPKFDRNVFLGNDLAVFARPIPENGDREPRFTYRSFRPINVPKPDWYALSPAGTSRNLTKDLPGVSGVPVHAGVGYLTVVGDGGVYNLYGNGRSVRLSPEVGGRFTLTSPGTFATSDSVIRPEFADEGLFKVNDQHSTKIVMIDFRDGHEGKAVVIDAPAREAAPLTGSLSAGAVLFRAEDGATSRLFLTNSNKGSSPREIAQINSRLDDINLGSWKTISYEFKDPAGKLPPQTIESCLLLPPGFSPDKLPPVVIEVYPNVGPNCKDSAPQLGPYDISWSPYLWAGKGFAYARLSTPRQLIRTAAGPIAGMPNLIDAGVDALIAKHLVDPTRMGLVGISQGGASALYVAAHSKRFKAVIAANSWADFFSHYFGSNGIYSYIYGESFGSFGRYDDDAASDFGFGRTPFADPEAYYRNSPVFLAPQISAPVLLVHSDMDSFSMSQFDEMYGALLRAGKDVRYVRYWGEGHGPSSPANIRDLWKRMGEFLTESGVGPTGSIHR